MSHGVALPPETHPWSSAAAPVGMFFCKKHFARNVGLWLSECGALRNLERLHLFGEVETECVCLLGQGGGRRLGCLISPRILWCICFVLRGQRSG